VALAFSRTRLQMADGDERAGGDAVIIGARLKKPS
jgi:hypothetical protein